MTIAYAIEYGNTPSKGWSLTVSIGSGHRQKCRKHAVLLSETEDVLTRRVLIVDDPFDASIEPRFRAMGTTARGRNVFVVFTMRGHRIRPLSACYMPRKEVK